MSRISRDEVVPSTGTDYWVYFHHPNPSIAEKPAETDDVVEDGKWMLFYPKSEMDARWKQACESLLASRFGIVRMMKASTFRENPRASDPDKGVIILYTPKVNKDVLMETGRLIMETMQYHVTMYFKTNVQTRGGTAATGQLTNHTLYLRSQLRYQDVFSDEFP